MVLENILYDNSQRNVDNASFLIAALNRYSAVARTDYLKVKSPKPFFAIKLTMASHRLVGAPPWQV